MTDYPSNHTLKARAQEPTSKLELTQEINQLRQKLADSACAMNAENDRHIARIKALETERARLWKMREADNEAMKVAGERESERLRIIADLKAKLADVEAENQTYTAAMDARLVADVADLEAKLAAAEAREDRLRRALSAAKADIGTVSITGSRAKGETARKRIDDALAYDLRASQDER